MLKRPGTGERWVSAIVGLETVEKKLIYPYVGSYNAISGSLADHPIVWSLLSHYVFWGFQTVWHSLFRCRIFECDFFGILYNYSFHLTTDFARRYSLGRRLY